VLKKLSSACTCDASGSASKCYMANSAALHTKNKLKIKKRISYGEGAFAQM